jgi:SAM-dependent methyltransferase
MSYNLLEKQTRNSNSAVRTGDRMVEFEDKDRPLDVVEIMEQIKAEIPEKKEQGFYHHAPQPGSSSALIQANPIELNPPLEGGTSLRQRLKRLMLRSIRKCIRWYLAAITKQIEQFHAGVVQVLNLLGQRIDDQDSEIGRMQDRFERRCDSIDERAKSEFVEHRRRLDQIERRTRNLLQEVETGGKTKAVSRAADSGARDAAPVDIDYFEFEALFRGSEEQIKDQQKCFIKYFTGKQNVLDIGCGRGEFLELCRENGIGAMGIDIDADMVLFCQEKGLDVRQADAIGFLDTIEDGLLGGVFMSQVVEHMDPNSLIKLIELCYRKQSDHSYFISETINPESLFVFAHSYYIDMSHVFPAHPKTIEFLLRSAGYQDISMMSLSPVPDEQKLQRVALRNYQGTRYEDAFDIHNRNIEKINELLYGDQHYAAIAEK